MGSDRRDFESVDPEWLRGKPGQKWHAASPLLAAWVADMDFRPATEITDHLRSIIDYGDLGYPDRRATGRSRATDAFVRRMKEKYGWDISVNEVREWNDVVQSLQAFLNVICMPGDSVVVHTPAYPPFFSAIEQAGCELLPVPAVVDGDTVTYDHDWLDRELALRPAKVLLLCNPQNPSGRVFTRQELTQLVGIAEQHDMIIISDEIHSDIVFDGRVHIPVASLPGAAGRTVTLNSASKSFNIAGLHFSVSHCGVPWVEERLASMPDHFFGGESNIMGAEGAWAAWTLAGDWFEDARGHLEKMRGVTVDMVRSRLPGVKVHLPQATYLAWLDCRDTAIGGDPHMAFQSAGVELSNGMLFGPGGQGHVRLNFATSTEMMDRITAALSTAF